MGVSTVRTGAEGAVPADAGHRLDELSVAAGPANGQDWPAATRFVFRFFLLYFVLYGLPFPFGWLPFTGWIAGRWNEAFAAVVVRAGDLVGRTVVIQPTGSGDTMYGWVAHGLVAGLALTGAAAWTAADRRRREYRTLDAWLRVYLRFYLGTTMIAYGAAKVIPTQFPYPTPDRMMQPLGEFSPMGLLWTFMGYSAAYNVFAGLGELVGGVLLFFRRTAVVGALLTIAVMANVVVLNFAYDVPVKLYSAHLLLVGVFLVAADLPALFRLLVLRRPTVPAPRPSPLPGRFRGVVAVLAALLLLNTLRVQFEQGMRFRRMQLEQPAYFGVWAVERMERIAESGQAVARDGGDEWSRLGLARGRAAITLASGAFERFLVRDDTLARTLTWTDRDDPAHSFVLGYRQPDADRMVLAGRVNGDSVEAVLRRAEWRDYLLVSRGFNWVQELPYNR